MKSKINRVLCFVLALTMVVLCVPLTSQNAEAANSLSDIITDKEFLTQAAKLLPSQHGSTVVYGNDVPGNYGKNTYWMFRQLLIILLNLVLQLPKQTSKQWVMVLTG